MQVIIDEVKVHNLESTVQSKLFNITLPINSVFGVEVGTTISADDGWYLMPEALSLELLISALELVMSVI
jgi:hypothetical protein